MMLSSQTIDNSRYGARVDIVSFCDLGVKKAGVAQCDNVANGCIGQLSDTSHMKTGFDCVGVIPATGRPLKVRDSVVGLVAINMIDLGQAKWIRNERHGYEAVNRDKAVKRCGTQEDEGVSPFTNARTQNKLSAVLPHTFTRSAPARVSVKAADVTEVADFVEVGDFRNRYRFPLFNAAYLAVSPGITASSNMAIIASQGGHPCR